MITDTTIITMTLCGDARSSFLEEIEGHQIGEFVCAPHQASLAPGWLKGVPTCQVPY